MPFTSGLAEPAPAKIPAGAQAQEVTTMADPRELARDLERAVLTTPGETGEALRRAIAARAGALAGRPGAGEPAKASDAPAIPPALAPYVDKVARHAYQVTDEDLAALAAAGLSDDAVFEVTVAAATGAGLARLERGLAALRGETP
jgi:alkylhydroperoxidase family enzyme